MSKKPYMTVKGVRQFKPVVTEREFYNDRSAGFCLACGEEAEGVEPDARKCTCRSCGAPKVYGLEELLVMNLVVIKAGRNDE